MQNIEIKIAPIEHYDSVVHNEVFTKLIMSLSYCHNQDHQVRINLDFNGFYNHEEVWVAIGYFLEVYCKHYKIATYKIPEQLYDPEVNKEVYFVNHEDPYIGYVDRDVLIVPRNIPADQERQLVDKLNPSVIIGL